MLNKLSEIRKIDFKIIKSEEEFKKVLQISENEWDEIMTYSQSSTDENTPAGFEDMRIQLDVLNEYNEDDVLDIDLVYSVKNEVIDSDGVKDFKLGELANIIAYIPELYIDKVLTFGEAAEIWNIDTSALRKSVERGRFLDGEVRKSGNTWLITKEAMVRLYGEIQYKKDIIDLELEGKKWSEVKKILENFITVDADNVGEDGLCIVDFVGDYSDFSVAGEIIENESESIVEIDDNEIIYKNN